MIRVFSLPTVEAAVAEDLYFATVQRDPAAQDPRADAIDRALDAVILKVTGLRASRANVELNNLRKNAAGYLDSIGSPSASEVEVRFRAVEINRALSEAGWPIWSVDRPQTVIWIAISDQNGGRAILHADPQLASAVSTSDLQVAAVSRSSSAHMTRLLNSLRTKLTNAADSRGLPFVLPKMDGRDQELVDFDDLWTYKFDRIESASARYMADAIVVGRVRESAIGTDVEWYLRINQDRRSLPGASFQEGMDWLADTYASQFRSLGGERSMVLRIANVARFEDYARVMSFVDSVSMLTRVDVESFSGQDLLLRVTSTGDAAVLERVLSFGNTLKRRTSAGGFYPPSGGSPVLGGVQTLEFSVARQPTQFQNPNRESVEVAIQ